MTPLPPWAELIGALAALLLALGTIYRYVWPAIKAFGRGVKGAVNFSEGAREVLDDFREVGGFAGLQAENKSLAEELATKTAGLADDVTARWEELAAKVAALQREVTPNGGTSMRDGVTRSEIALRTLTVMVEELRAHAEASREGLDDLRDQANDLGRRLTDLDERQEFLRAADRQYAEDLKRYLDNEHRDLQLGNEALRAALNEVLSIDQEELP